MNDMQFSQNAMDAIGIIASIIIVVGWLTPLIVLCISYLQYFKYALEKKKEKDKENKK